MTIGPEMPGPARTSTDDFTCAEQAVDLVKPRYTMPTDQEVAGSNAAELGLIREDEGIAAEALESLGIELVGVLHQVEEIIGRGELAPSDMIPFTRRAKRALDLSMHEAQHLGHKRIGTEHLLLGLIREDEGVGAQLLVKLGAELNRVRQDVLRLLAEEAELTTRGTSGTMFCSNCGQKIRASSNYCRYCGDKIIYELCPR